MSTSSVAGFAGAHVGLSLEDVRVDGEDERAAGVPTRLRRLSLP